MNYKLSDPSIWIFFKYLELEQELENNLNTYELAHSVDSLYKFLWDNFANWYIEYLKTDKTQIPFAKDLFRQYIVTLSPYAPFETEALWEQFFNEKKLLAFELKDPNWSQNILKSIPDPNSGQNFQDIIDLINDLRSFRGLFAIDPVNFINVSTTNPEFDNYLDFIKLAGRAEVTIGEIENLYIIQSNKFKLGIDLKSYIKDKNAETERTNKIILSLDKQILQLQNQLANQQFIDNAEPEVITEKQENLANRQSEKQQQEQKLEFLKN